MLMPGLRQQTKLLHSTVFASLIVLGGCLSYPAESQTATPESTTAAKAAASCVLPAKISKNTQLDQSCTYKGSTIITASNVTLDCRGAQITGEGAKGPLVQVRGRGLQNVTVKNCRLINSPANGLRVASDLNAKALDAIPKVEDRYAAAPSNILVENVTVSNSEASGIYVDAYVSRTTIRKATVEGAGSVGIYLEQSSADNTIEDSTLRRNGFGSKAKPRKGIARREGIAVDSSARNTIRNNQFDHNAAGGIFLYKNCGEKNGVHRWQSSEKNTISGNTFSSEEIGVWVASRQSRDLSSWGCSDKPYTSGIYLDSAKDNTISGNKFNGVLAGIKIEDNGTQILNNTLTSFICLTVGSKPRNQHLKQPVEGTVVVGNNCTADAAALGYVFTDGAKPKEFKDNQVNSQPASPSFQ